MPVGDLGDAAANYDLTPVDEDPFSASSIADKYITRSGQPVSPQAQPQAATSLLADKYTRGSQISDPEWMNWQEENAQAEQRGAEWGAATETFDPQTMKFIGRTGGTLPQARAQIQRMYPSGPSADDPQVMQRAYSDLIGRRRQFSGSPVSQGGRGGLGQIGVFGSAPLMAPRLVGHPGYQLHDPYAEPSQPQLPPEEGFFRGGRVGFQEGGFLDWVFGRSERPASLEQPHSTGALLGAQYQDLPESPNIEDRRQDPRDYAYWHSSGDNENYVTAETASQYQPSIPVPQSMSGVGYDPMLQAAAGLDPDTAEDVAPYRPSFQPNLRVQRSGQAPYQRFDAGPHLPHSATLADDAGPFVHLPWSPGDPGWTSPPSPSGPHNRRGDPPRPGYDRPVFTSERVGYQEGGDVTDDAPLGQGGIGSDYKLEAVNHDPFAPLDAMQARDRAAHPEQYQPAPAPAAPEPHYWGGDLGAAVEHGYQKAAGYAGDLFTRGTEGLGSFGASIAADPLSYLHPSLAPTSYRTMSPESEAKLGRDIAGEIQNPFGLGAAVTAAHPPEPTPPRVGEVGAAATTSAAPARAQVMDINGVKRHIDPDFPESRIATSAPWAADASPHANNDLNVGMDLAKQTPDTFAKNARLITGGTTTFKRKGQTITKPIESIPYIKGHVDPVTGERIDLQKATPEQAHESAIQHMTSNIVATHDAISPDVRPGSKQWYEGANEIARQNAIRTNIPHENSAGVYAALSPQKDWHQNVALGDRTSHIAATTDRATTMSPDMVDWVYRYADRKPSLADVEASGGKRVANTVYREDVLNKLAQLQEKPWGDMSNRERAFYVRAYDEAHGPPDHLLATDEQTGQPSQWQDEKGDWKTGHYIMNPDGTSTGKLARYGEDYPNKMGQPIPVSWGSEGEIEDALNSHYANSMSEISEAIGSGHKRRSFYNNIIAPWSKKGDVTTDTHAIAVALLRPLGASASEVSHGLGQTGSTNAATGVQGLYPNVAEAYRRAAKIISDRNPYVDPLLPRELQSITWEGVRGLWSPVEKSTKAVVDRVNGLWADYMAGRKTQEEVQRAILGERGENIRPPNWWGSFNAAGPMDQAMIRARQIGRR